MDSMRSMGLEIDRPVVPTSLEISTDEAELLDPQSHPVKVSVDQIRAVPKYGSGYLFLTLEIGCVEASRAGGRSK